MSKQLITNYADLIGKTIVNTSIWQRIGYDDTGFLRLDFDDGTYAIIRSRYGAYTGDSSDEYPTRIALHHTDADLMPCSESL